MNGFKKAVGWTIGLGLLIMGAASAHAAVDCGQASVKAVGVLPKIASATASPYLAGFVCHDTDVKWAGEKQFVLSVDLGDSGYATLLSAASLKQTVYIRVEDPTQNRDRKSVV